MALTQRPDGVTTAGDHDDGPECIVVADDEQLGWGVGEQQALGRRGTAPRSPGSATVPRPCRRTMRGRRSKEANIRQMRPFSRRCAIVSTPLPVWSTQPTWRGPRMDRLAGPRGETLTCPSAASGAVATNHTGCALIHEAKTSSMPSKTLPTCTKVGGQSSDLDSSLAGRLRRHGCVAARSAYTTAPAAAAERSRSCCGRGSSDWRYRVCRSLGVSPVLAVALGSISTTSAPSTYYHPAGLH